MNKLLYVWLTILNDWCIEKDKCLGSLNMSTLLFKTHIKKLQFICQKEVTVPK